jgi:hypothetical protein
VIAFTRMRHIHPGQRQNFTVNTAIWPHNGHAWTRN